jgi:hypothetical protein
MKYKEELTLFEELTLEQNNVREGDRGHCSHASIF